MAGAGLLAGVVSGVRTADGTSGGGSWGVNITAAGFRGEETAEVE